MELKREKSRVSDYVHNKKAKIYCTYFIRFQQKGFHMTDKNSRFSTISILFFIFFGWKIHR